MKFLKIKIVWGEYSDNWAQIATLELVTAASNCTGKAFPYKLYLYLGCNGLFLKIGLRGR